MRNLEIIGEAAKHVPDDLLRAAPAIDWRKVAAFRDVLAHAYHGIDDDVLWDVVDEKIRELATQFTDLLGRIPT